jgi:hypothetical protein
MRLMPTPEQSFILKKKETMTSKFLAGLHDGGESFNQ